MAAPIPDTGSAPDSVAEGVGSRRPGRSWKWQRWVPALTAVGTTFLSSQLGLHLVSLGILTLASLALALANLGVVVVHVRSGYLNGLLRRTTPGAARSLHMLTIADGASSALWMGCVWVAFQRGSILGVLLTTAAASAAVLFLASYTHDLLPRAGKQRGTEVIKRQKAYRAAVRALKKLAPITGLPKLGERLEDQGGEPTRVSTFKSSIIALTLAVALIAGVATAEGKISSGRGSPSEKEGQGNPVGHQPWEGDQPHGDYSARCQRETPGRLPDGKISQPLHDLWLAAGRGLGAGQGGCSNTAIPIPNFPGAYVSFGRCGPDNLTAGITLPAQATTAAYAVMIQGTQGVAFTSKTLLDGTLAGATRRYNIGPGQMYAITTTAGSFLFVRPLTNGGPVPPAQRKPHGACDASSTVQYPYSVLSPAAARLLLDYVSTHGWVWPIADDAAVGAAPGLSFTLHRGAVSGPVEGHLWCVETTCTLAAGAWQNTTSATVVLTDGQLAAVSSSLH